MTFPSDDTDGSEPDDLARITGPAETSAERSQAAWLGPNWLAASEAGAGRRHGTPQAGASYSQQALVDFWAIDRVAASGLAALRASPAWMAMKDPATPASQLLALSGEVLWIVSLFEPARLEAGHIALSRLGRADIRLATGLQRYLEDESLLIDGVAATAERLCGPLSGPSPAASGIAARWYHLARSADPVGLLGAAYCVEAISAGCAKALQAALGRRDTAPAPLRWATEQGHCDAVHAVFLKHLILDVLTSRPGAAGPMLHWAETLAPLHPLPIWIEAQQRSAQRGGTSIPPDA